MTGFVANTSKIGHLWVTKYNKCSSANIRFQSASNNLVGLLTVGAVIGTGVTVGNYLIEWHLGSITGPIQLYSGYGPDPLIQAVHPFVNEPVEGGILYAVIRYIFIDGIRYSPNQLEGQYSPDLTTCLGTITVLSMTCDNGSANQYSHDIVYTTNVNPAQDAERTLKYILSSNGSVNYLALYFEGFAVADRFDVSYVHSGDEANPILLTDWVVGTNATSNFTSNPKVLSSQTLKLILDLNETYTSGDYLSIHITPRVLQPTIADTNWKMHLKCLQTIDCGSPTVNNKTMDVSTLSFTWDATNCQYILKVKAVEPYFPTDWLYYQMSVQYMTDAPLTGSFNTYTKEGQLYLKNNTTWNNSYINGFYSGCYQLTNPTVITKTGSTLVYAYNELDEYNRAKAGWSNIINSAAWASFQASDDSMAMYASTIQIRTQIGTSCGDTYTTDQPYIHASSTFTWNDSNQTLTIGLVNFTSTYPQTACNNTYTTIQGIRNSVAGVINAADYVKTTYRGVPLAGVAMMYPNLVTLAQTAGIMCFGAAINPAFLYACYPTSWKSNQSPPGTNYQWFGEYLMRVGVEITNTSDALNNYRVTNYMDTSGNLFTPGVIIYEKANGIQIIP